MNLIPEQSGTTPNYWCTWGIQNSSLQSREHAENLVFTGDQGAHSARENLNAELLFGKNGWSDQFDGIRGDLSLMLDDGWDVAYGIHPKENLSSFGSVLPDPQRFPFCTGSPEERLEKLNRKVQSRGWRDVGLWIAPQVTGETREHPATGKEQETFLRDRLRWTSEAGIRLWKVDWGIRSGDLQYRRLISEIAREINPEIRIEHSVGLSPLNAAETSPEGKQRGSGRFADMGDDLLQKISCLLSFSDMVRIYDLLYPLTVPTSIDRLAFYLSCSDGVLLNVENELYLGAASGTSFGIMRSEREPEPQIDLGPIQSRDRKILELFRAVRWQRIAPAWKSSYQEPVTLSKTILTDCWTYRPDTVWLKRVFNQKISQGAPAVLARNLPLPQVLSRSGEVPYLVTSRHPNGAISIGFLPRLSDDRGFYTPPATVALSIPCEGVPIGVFGVFESLRFPVANGKKRLIGQDLAQSEAVDLSAFLQIHENIAEISGEVVKAVTVSKEGDFSDPGIVLKLLPET